jgi:hypothetical protein
VSSATLRNAGIVVLLALAVFLLPGGGTAANTAIALISVAFSVAIWFFAMRMYREHRMTLFGLGDRHRGILYASAAGLLFCGASARHWWTTAAGTLGWMVLFAACLYGLFVVWRYHRQYG